MEPHLAKCIFNSSMVRLKCQEMQFRLHVPQFQFHYGSIKRQYGNTEMIT